VVVIITVCADVPVACISNFSQGKDGFPNFMECYNLTGLNINSRKANLGDGFRDCIEEYELILLA